MATSHTFFRVVIGTFFFSVAYIFGFITAGEKNEVTLWEIYESRKTRFFFLPRVPKSFKISYSILRKRTDFDKKKNSLNFRIKEKREKKASRWDNLIIPSFCVNSFSKAVYISNANE